MQANKELSLQTVNSCPVQKHLT